LTIKYEKYSIDLTAQSHMSISVIEVPNAVEAFVDNPKWPTKIEPVKVVLEELYGNYLEIVKGRRFLSETQINRLSLTISKSEQEFQFSRRATRLPTASAIEIIKYQAAIALNINPTSSLNFYIDKIFSHYQTCDLNDPFLRSFSQMMHFEALSKPSLPHIHDLNFRGLITPTWRP
jgi:hypothetical protein